MFTVIIPARNAVEHLPAQLAALAAQTYQGAWEVIVADNGSTDGTAERALAAMPRPRELRVVDASGRRGIAHARNAGGAVARGDFLLFVDADDLVAPGWLDAMARAAPECDGVGGCCELTGLNDPRFLELGGERAVDLEHWPGYLPYAAGANCGMRASVFAALGGFDETYVDGGDDVEPFWRLQLAGFRLGFVEDAVVHYRQRPTLAQLARQHYRYGLQDPHLFHDFRAAGMPPSPPRQALRTWARLFLRAPRDWQNPARRREWVRLVSQRAGRVAGSARYRTIYL